MTTTWTDDVYTLEAHDGWRAELSPGTDVRRAHELFDDELQA